MNFRISLSALLFFSIAPLFSVGASTLRVGPGQSFSTPCQAFASAVSGDIIEIDANGSYAGDVCAVLPSSLIIRGVNGRAVLDASGRSAEGKAIWVVKGSNTTIENVEFKNARVLDKNGAGIRLEGTNLTVRNCFFHHNENGILTGANANSEVLIERSEFAFNGAGDGYSHNMYIGGIKKFTLRGSFSHDANVGHLVKSRAQENRIEYNRLTNENNGNASYEIDLPNGGRSYIIGNVIQQGPAASNSAMISFGAEGANAYNDLYLINNTIVNDRSTGYFVNLRNASAPTAIARNNVFAGVGQVFNTTAVVNENNYVNSSPAFVSRSTYDYRPAAGAPFINSGKAPGISAVGLSLTPTLEYVHPLSTKARVVDSMIDIGAFEYGTATTVPAPTPASCTFNGQTIASGSSVTAYQSASVPYGSTCVSQTRTCSNGVLSGSYAYASCSVQAAPPPSTDTQAPSVRITFPVNGSLVSRYSTVSIATAATDNVAVTRVETFVNGTLMCRDTTAPYTCAWRVPSGYGRYYKIQSFGYDMAGNKGTSSIVQVRSK